MEIKVENLSKSFKKNENLSGNLSGLFMACQVEMVVGKVFY